MTEFKIKFRGVRGSHPVASQEFLKYGGNTSCVEVNIDGRLIILDAGTGLINLGDELMQNYINSGTTLSNRKPVRATLLLSHIHQDHIMGLPFWAPLHVASTQLHVFGSPVNGGNLEEELSETLFNKTFPLDAGDIAADVICYDINETNYIIIKKDLSTVLMNVCDYMNSKHSDDDIVISCYKSYAHPQNGVLIYRIEYKGKSLVYATDKESYIGADKKFIQFAYNADCLIHDAQYTYQDYINPIQPKQGFGHSTFEMAIENYKLSKSKKLFFFHYDPEYDDERLSMLEKEFANIEENIYFAKENYEIEL